MTGQCLCPPFSCECDDVEAATRMTRPDAWAREHDNACTPERPNRVTCCAESEPVACDWCGRAIVREWDAWHAVRGAERGYDPITCDAAEDGLHEPPPDPLPAGVNAPSVPPAKATPKGDPAPGGPAPAAGVGDDLGIPAQHVEYLCSVMHTAYEDEAARLGWKTQPASQARWEDVPEANKAAMRAGVRALLDRLFRPEDGVTEGRPSC